MDNRIETMATACTTDNRGDEIGGGDASAVKARLHIESLRKNKFSIGDSKQNPLTADLHEAVTSLSAQLYTKDVHFLMELIQNAEDNQYAAGVEPALEFVLTTKDITGVGAPATLLVFNNEVGFSPKNMESICSVGRSTKKGLRNNGFIGEKGIGFKSVFLVSAQPYIFSNGYGVKFNELPTQGRGVGYIVPEWVDNNPTVEDIQSVYGEDKILPATTIILPLKLDKVEAVKKQLSEVHPEVLLFLTKIKKLSIRENDGDSSSTDSVSSVAIASDTSLISLKNEIADSRIVQLSVEEGKESNESTCRYLIWRQAFDVKPDCVVDGRYNVKEWGISLAFPFGKRLKRGASSVGVFAYLPTAMVTNFPFIIQADFILASSRETILLDSKWNLGILKCVPLCFKNAITSLMKSSEAIKFFPVASMLHFLPVRESSYKELNIIRDSIKTLMKDECIIPCESFSKHQKRLCQPIEALRIFPDFRTILLRIKKLGIDLNGIYSLGKFVLHSSVDLKQYDEALSFVGVLSVRESYRWYGKCVVACSLIMHPRLPLEIYMDLLCFFCNVGGHLHYEYVKDVPLLIYAAGEKLELCSFSQIRKRQYKIYIVPDFGKHDWLSMWNIRLKCPNKTFFMASYIVDALLKHKKKQYLETWLKNTVRVVFTTISQYCCSHTLFIQESKNQKLAVSMAHLLYHANLKQFIHTDEIAKVLLSLPIVDGCGKIHAFRSKLLVPASVSKWVKLLGSNPFFRVPGAGGEKLIDLGEAYMEAADFGIDITENKELFTFLEKYTDVIDLPNIPYLNKELDVANFELTQEQAILLFDWIRWLRGTMVTPSLSSKFIESIANGSWLKTYSGFHSPNKCCLTDGDEEITLLIKNVREHFPIVDQQFYDGKIKSYVDELKVIGVTIGIEHMNVLVIRHLHSGASFTKSKDWVIFLLHLIKILKCKYMLSEDLVNAAKKGEWIKTNRGYSNPIGSIFLRSNDESILQITDLHVIDAEFYESKMECFTTELELLGVVVNLEGSNLNLVAQNFKFPKNVSALKKSNILLILRCIRHMGDAGNVFTENLKVRPWIKTSYGVRRPSECVLPSKKWAHLFKTLPLPLIDESMHGSELKEYKDELKTIGVVVDCDGITKLLCDQVKTMVSYVSLTRTHVISILEFIKCMSKEMASELLELKNSLMEVKWLNTLHGYKSAPDSVLLDSKWGTIVQFVDLPLIDEVFYSVAINQYKDQLKMLGVVVDFAEGAHIVAKGLRVLEEDALMTADAGLSLLECVRTLRLSPHHNQHYYEELLDKLKVSRWLKTHLGYRYPEETILLDAEWKLGLEKYDAPFIDENFYSNLASLDKADFKAIGVKTDLEEVCSGVYEMLSSHTQTSAVFRIYRFLHKFNWSQRSQGGCSPKIWIPDDPGSGGQWVESRVCVLHDKGNLFHSRLHSLDNYYDNELLLFFKLGFGVAEEPSVHDYITLWKGWISGMHKVSSFECSFFWSYVSEQWNSANTEIFEQELVVLPATTSSREDILFVHKSNLFIPDDLQLKKLFSDVSAKPLFVWYPQDNPLSHLSQPKLFDIYTSLGVKRISQSVQIETSCALLVGCKSEVVDVDSKDQLIGKSLMKIVLGFLASNQMNMQVDARHKTARTLLGLTVVVTGKPIEMKYILKTCSVEQTLSVTVKRMVMWDKSSARLIVKAASWSKQRNNIEFVTDFARTISEGILPCNTELVDSLCKIIQMGFAFGFKEDAVDFLLMTENLELSSADRDFINRAFAPVYYPTSLDSSEPDIVILDSLSTPEIPTRKRKALQYISD